MRTESCEAPTWTHIMCRLGTLMIHTQKTYKLEPWESVKKHNRKLESINFPDQHRDPKNQGTTKKRRQISLPSSKKKSVTKIILTFNLATSMRVTIPSTYLRGLSYLPFETR